MESLLVSDFISSKGFIIETGDQNTCSGCNTMHENNVVCVIRKNAPNLTQHQAAGGGTNMTVFCRSSSINKKSKQLPTTRPKTGATPVA